MTLDAFAHDLDPGPVLVIDTRPPGSRRVGGGLDGPDTAPRPVPRTRRRRRPLVATTGPDEALGDDLQAEADVDELQEPAAPAAELEEEVDDDHAPDPKLEIRLPADLDPVAELEEVRAALARVVPSAPAASAADLVRHVAHKLTGHGPDCAQLRHPTPGSIGVDEARARCRAVLDALCPVERSAVLDLLAHDLALDLDRNLQ